MDLEQGCPGAARSFAQFRGQRHRFDEMVQILQAFELAVRADRGNQHRRIEARPAMDKLSLQELRHLFRRDDLAIGAQGLQSP